jgi:hypothetical protein
MFGIKVVEAERKYNVAEKSSYWGLEIKIMWGG